MDSGNPIRKMAAVAVLGLAVSSLVACAAEDAISKADFEALGQQVAATKQQLAAKEKEAADAQQKLKDAQSVKALTVAKPGATPTPAPPPTPLPAGTAPPPPRVSPASYREAVPFSFYVETILSENVYSGGWNSTLGCAPSSVFKRGMSVVFRYEIFDMATGRRLIDTDEPTVKIKVPNQPEITSRFSQRGGGRAPDAPWMWSGRWDVPHDYPLGAVDYTISVATKDGRNFTWKQPALVNEAAKTDSRLRIMD